MENRILINDDQTDNRFFLDYDKAIKLIKEIMEVKLPDFEIKEINDKKQTFYYYIIFENKNFQIKLGGDRGYMIYDLFVDGKEFIFEKEIITKIKTASEKNTSLIIDIIADELKKIEKK